MFIGAVAAIANGNMLFLPSEFFNFSAAVSIAVATILLCRRLINAGQADRLFRAVFWLSIGSVGTFYISHFFGFNAAIHEGVIRTGRMSGFFSNPNEMGIQAQFATALGFCMAARTLNVKYLIITLAVVGPAVMGTNSRSSILAVGAIVGILSFFVFPPKYVVRTTFSLSLIHI